MNKGTIRIDHQVMGRGFVRLPLEALCDPALSPRALRALALLLHYDFRGRGYPGHKVAAAELGWDRATQLRALRELEHAGWLQRRATGPGSTVALTVVRPQRFFAEATQGDSATLPSQNCSLTRSSSATSVGAELPPPLKNIQELLKEDPHYRLVYEAVRDAGIYFGRHPQDLEAQQALREICAANTVEKQQATIAKHAQTLARLRRELACENSSRTAPARLNRPAATASSAPRTRT